MGGFVEFYREGGAFMHLVTLVGFPGAIVGIVAIVLRQKVVAGIALGAGVLCLALGAAGTYLGVVEVRRAAATVSPEHAQSALAVGMEIAAYPIKYAGVVCVPALLGGLLGLVLSRSR